MIKRILLAALYCCSGVALTESALAQAPAGAGAGAAAYPAKSVRIVVPATAGDGSDVLGRTLAKALGESLGQTFVIENKPGAGGSIGADAVAKAVADGYTLFLGNGSSHGVTPGLYARLPYDSINDFDVGRCESFLQSGYREPFEV